MYLKLVRIESTERGTSGILYGPDGPICLTLELPWLSNARFSSCIPLGSYSLIRYTSRRFGETFLFSFVPSRGGILFHPGNTVADSKGCILTVSSLSKGRGFGSKVAHSKFMKALTGVDEATIDIVSAHLPNGQI